MAEHPAVISLLLCLIVEAVSCRNAALSTSSLSPKPFPTAATPPPQLVRPADISHPTDDPEARSSMYPPPKVDSSSLKPFYPPSKCTGRCYELSIRNNATEDVLVSVMYWQQHDWYFRGDWKLKPGQVVHAANTDSTFYYVWVASLRTEQECMLGQYREGRLSTFENERGDRRSYVQFTKSKKDWSPELLKVNCD